MRILILSVFVFGVAAITSCSTPRTPEEMISVEMSDFKAAAARTIEDSKNALEFERQVAELERLLFRFSDQGQAFQKDLQQLNAKYDAKDGEFAALFERYSQERISLRGKMLEVHLKMLALTTDKEWKSLHKYERKAVAAGQYRGG